MNRCMRISSISGLVSGISRILAPSSLTMGSYLSAAPQIIRHASGVVKDGEDPKKITALEWRDRLDRHTYNVTREKGTERAFTGAYANHHEDGTYTCSCCNASLFDSRSKFESGSGWPSFHTALGAEGKDDSSSNVGRHTDISWGMKRVEVICNKCDAHLGHVFDDGPRPTGLRYCINSVSLGFKPVKNSEEPGEQ